MKIRIRFHFTGDVQGVGFRFRAYHSAQLLGLTGWVKNEDNGSVVMEVQGEKEKIDTLLKMIENGHYIHIDTSESKEVPLDLHESSFVICE